MLSAETGLITKKHPFSYEEGCFLVNLKFILLNNITFIFLNEKVQL